jgi:hypothetical protein
MKLPIAFLASALAALLGTGFAACGGSTDNGAAPGTDAGSAMDTAPPPPPQMDAAPTPEAAAPEAAPYPAFTPQDFPQVISGGGPVMTAPKIVPVLFADDDPMTTAAIADFVSKVGQTQYWKAITTEYGAGVATGEAPIMLTAADNPPTTIDDSAIQAWLVGKLNANDPAFGTPDVNTLYAIFYPAGVTVTLGGGGGGDAGVPDGGGGFGGQASCTSFGGYHQNVQLDAAHQNMNIAYAVMPRCASFGPLTGLDVITGAASHEFAEAATDPFPVSMSVMPAYAQVDDMHIYWMSILGGGEIGDMCAQSAASFTKFAELPKYTVQRCWSNKAEAAGQDPCVPPLPGEVYFNSVPILKDMVPYTIGGQTLTVKGVHIPATMSGTVELDLFSDAPTTGPWTVSAVDGATLRGRPAQLQFAFDKPSGQNGDKIQMTITVVNASTRKRESFVVLSKLNGRTNLWAGVVGN